ncbi:hypothetical protein [Lichenicola sp.]|uniref:hypothetical protein n=1 Tax=Lichenicola sp. TaxID=2804529 RepID=UPI003B00FACB
MQLLELKGGDEIGIHVAGARDMAISRKPGREVYRGPRGGRQQANVRAISLFLPSTLLRYGVTTRLRQAHFLAQACEESWGLSDTEEERSGAEYQGRKDLDETHPGDGVRFRVAALFN